MARFKPVADGEWVQPRHRGYKIACCDCGLVHTFNFSIYRGHVFYQAVRNNRSTAMMRRWKRAKQVTGQRGKSRT